MRRFAHSRGRLLGLNVGLTNRRVLWQDAGGRARLIVADQGPGLSDAQQLKVFEKFERLGRSGEDGGSGLGLYISRRLARAMGGDLLVESAPGQGARFVLEVPADLLAQAPTTAQQNHDEQPDRS